MKMNQDPWLERLAAGHPLEWPEQPLPGGGRALALAPHPDDPEAIAVTLNLLSQGGWDLVWAVLTPAWSGVQDDFAGPQREMKAQVRESEQRAAARLFGLPESKLHFLRLAENNRGEMADQTENRQRLFSFLAEISPDLVLLPWREDTNASHRLTYRWFSEWASSASRPIVALGNEDPKSITIQPVFQVVFGEETARWKAALLECHRSQSARNLAVRRISFSERILSMNRACPGLKPGTYAERFQVEIWK